MNKRRRASLIILILLLFLAGPLHAWTDHALMTYPALQNEERYSKVVATESIEQFLRKEKDKVAKTLDGIEEWAKGHIEAYPVLPNGLRFSAGREPDLLKRFVMALRVNPSRRFPLFIHPYPGAGLNGRAVMPWRGVSILKTDYVGFTLAALRQGDMVQVREIIASASDEPDYGYDMFLWEDNGTEAGRQYRLGKQPFGNPAIEYATQAPFHMGFFHESGIVFTFAPALKKTYPEYRFRQYTMLSRLAFETGHSYWGYRFAGMALHYIQDLTNPYHATIVPGTSTIKILWVSLLDVIGIHGPREKVLKEVSDFHILIEHLQNQKLKALLVKKDYTDRMTAALGDNSRDGKSPAFHDQYLREIVSLESNRQADRTRRIFDEAVSDREMFDRIQKLDAAGPFDILPMISGSSKEALDALDGLLADLMRADGVYTRIYLKSVVP